MQNALRFLRRRLTLALGLFGIITLLGSLVIVFVVQIPSADFIKSVERLPAHPDAVVILGAGIEDSGKPSDALEDRLIVGERVSALLNAPMLLSGDGGRFRRDEISVMHRWLLDHGSAPDRIVIDDQGYRTYETCKRAARVYRLKKVVLITQRFHLGRAIYLCRSFGLETYGVPANIRTYKKDLWFVTRDVLASLKAWLDVNIIHPDSPVEL